MQMSPNASAIELMAHFIPKLTDSLLIAYIETRPFSMPLSLFRNS